MIILVMLLGKVVIWTAQTTSVLDFLRRISFFNNMLLCDYCTGFWIYLVLVGTYGQALTAPLPWNPVTWVLEAMAMSYAMHLISEGWRCLTRQ